MNTIIQEPDYITYFLEQNSDTLSFTTHLDFYTQSFQPYTLNPQTILYGTTPIEYYVAKFTIPFEVPSNTIGWFRMYFPLVPCFPSYPSYEKLTCTIRSGTLKRSATFDVVSTCDYDWLLQTSLPNKHCTLNISAVYQSLDIRDIVAFLAFQTTPSVYFYGNYRDSDIVLIKYGKYKTYQPPNWFIFYSPLQFTLPAIGWDSQEDRGVATVNVYLNDELVSTGTVKTEPLIGVWSTLSPQVIINTNDKVKIEWTDNLITAPHHRCLKPLTSWDALMKRVIAISPKASYILPSVVFSTTTEESGKRKSKCFGTGFHMFPSRDEYSAGYIEKYCRVKEIYITPKRDPDEPAPSEDVSCTLTIVNNKGESVSIEGTIKHEDFVPYWQPGATFYGPPYYKRILIQPFTLPGESTLLISSTFDLWLGCSDYWYLPDKLEGYLGQFDFLLVCDPYACVDIESNVGCTFNLETTPLVWSKMLINTLETAYDVHSRCIYSRANFGNLIAVEEADTSVTIDTSNSLDIRFYNRYSGTISEIVIGIWENPNNATLICDLYKGQTYPESLITSSSIIPTAGQFATIPINEEISAGDTLHFVFSSTDTISMNVITPGDKRYSKDMVLHPQFILLENTGSWNFREETPSIVLRYSDDHKDGQAYFNRASDVAMWISTIFTSIQRVSIPTAVSVLGISTHARIYSDPSYPLYLDIIREDGGDTLLTTSLDPSAFSSSFNWITFPARINLEPDIYRFVFRVDPNETGIYQITACFPLDEEVSWGGTINTGIRIESGSEEDKIYDYNFQIDYAYFYLIRNIYSKLRTLIESCEDIESKFNFIYESRNVIHSKLQVEEVEETEFSEFGAFLTLWRILVIEFENAWNNLKKIIKPKGLEYLKLNFLQKAFQATYFKLNKRVQTLLSRYKELEITQGVRRLSYRVLWNISRSLGSLYNNFLRLIRNRSVQYAIIERISNILHLTYTSLEKILQVMKLRYRLKILTSNIVSTGYFLKQIASKIFISLYDMEGILLRHLSSSYSFKNLKEAWISFSDNIRNLASSFSILKYLSRELKTSIFSSKYRTREIIHSFQEIIYSLRSTLVSFFTLGYIILTRISQILVLFTYKVLGQVFNFLSLVYKLFSSFVQSMLEMIYTSRNKVVGLSQLIYNLHKTVPIQLISITYYTLSRISKMLRVFYSLISVTQIISSISIISRIMNNSIRAFVSRYNLKTSIVRILRSIYRASSIVSTSLESMFSIGFSRILRKLSFSYSMKRIIQSLNVLTRKIPLEVLKRRVPSIELIREKTRSILKRILKR